MRQWINFLQSRHDDSQNSHKSLGRHTGPPVTAALRRKRQANQSFIVNSASIKKESLRLERWLSG